MIFLPAMEENHVLRSCHGRNYSILGLADQRMIGSHSHVLSSLSKPSQKLLVWKIYTAQGDSPWVGPLQICSRGSGHKTIDISRPIHSLMY